MNGYLLYLNNFFQIITKKSFQGWGRKKTGKFASWCYKTFGGKITLLEDGFIRSLDLGVKGSPSFSLVEDDIGIYYDATTSSKLENILLDYDFGNDVDLMNKAKEAIELIREYHISKYNHARDLREGEIPNRPRTRSGDLKNEIPNQVGNDVGFVGNNVGFVRNVLIIAQTAGDSSLEYGLGNIFTTDDMIKAALEENPVSKIYLKIHPDVLSGKKASDIDIKNIDKNISIISEDVNPISLLKHFDKVYTKTSGMGFESLLLGCECVCFGMPFYAGWGITDDRLRFPIKLGMTKNGNDKSREVGNDNCRELSNDLVVNVFERRTRILSLEEVFAGAYILYTRYVNPYTKKEIDIVETIKTINEFKNEKNR